MEGLLQPKPPLTIKMIKEQLQADTQLQLNHQKVIRVPPPLPSQRQTTQDATKPICPPICQIEKWPAQKVMTKAYYDRRAEEMIEEAGEDKELRHLLTSNKEYGAGEQFKANPSSREFRVVSDAFRYMLMLHLGLWIPQLPQVCVCGHQIWSHESLAGRRGRHLLSCTKCSAQTSRHDQLRSVLHSMYSELGAKVVTEKQGLLPVSEGRPADIFVPAMVHQTSKNIALDLCIIDPASKSALTTNPHVSLWEHRNMQRRRR